MSDGAFVAMRDLAEKTAAERDAQYKRVCELGAEVSLLRSEVTRLKEESEMLRSILRDLVDLAGRTYPEGSAARLRTFSLPST